MNAPRDSMALESARRAVLQRYGITPGAWLSAGMEAEVYALDADRVLKLYPASADLTRLQILRDFYAALERHDAPFALPRILELAAEDGLIVAVEQRLAGRPLTTLLPLLAPERLDLVMRRYLDAALAVPRCAARPVFAGRKLFAPAGADTGDWHQFLARELQCVVSRIAPYLQRDIPQFRERLNQLQAILGLPYHGDERLIHGDFCPGNLLVDDTLQVTALLDFGILTMVGDPFFDIATAWVFFDMYAELKANARERLLALLLDRLGAAARGRLYRYVLIYSILSADTYSTTCADGHYQWCVTNLNTRAYWDAIA